jgi:SAM-dependent methyltransferase
MQGLAVEHTISEPSSRILDIGCGKRKQPGAVGMDLRALPGVDIIHDLTHFPYPFPSDSFSVVHANHVLEHVPDVMNVMAEIWRICEPDALVHIRVPHCTGALAWRDPTHVRSFTSESFRYFGQNNYSFYTNARFSVVFTRLVYRADQVSRGLPTRIMRKLVQSFIDAHPTFGERQLAYAVGGIDEIQVTLRARKDSTN